MKVLCTKTNLTKGMTTVARLVGGGNTLPILNNVLLKTDKGRLRLSTTNLELALSVWVGGKIEEEGETTVPARLFADFVTTLLEEKISLSSSKTTLLIEGENMKTRLNGLAADDFPIIPEGGEEIFGVVKERELKEAIREISFAAGRTETQPEISGVLFVFGKKTLTLAATDRYRLGERQIKMEKEGKGERAVIVPHRTTIELERVLGEGAVEVYLKEGQIQFRTTETEIVSRLIEGQYPDYKQIIPSSFLTHAVIEKTDFVQALKAVSLFATDNHNIELTLGPSKGEVILKGQSGQVGNSEVVLKQKVQGQTTTVTFNYRYLLECLNNLNDEQIELRLINPSSPAALVPAKRDNYLYLVMPIKT